VDKKTVETYAQKANEFSQEWLEQPAPSDIYDLVEKYFIKNGKTIDVGCGNGRDTNWLNSNGFPAIGVDVSENLLMEARRLFPLVDFAKGVLPQLEDVQDTFSNVFCETVIMHLPSTEIGVAVQRIKSLSDKNGVVYLSWRVTEKEDFRDPKGRLYSAFEPKFVLNYFEEDEVLYFEDKISKSSGKRVCRLIAKIL
jgi:SAM-dependent methyltransferase